MHKFCRPIKSHLTYHNTEVLPPPPHLTLLARVLVQNFAFLHQSHAHTVIPSQHLQAFTPLAPLRPCVVELQPYARWISAAIQEDGQSAVLCRMNVACLLSASPGSKFCILTCSYRITSQHLQAFCVNSSCDKGHSSTFDTDIRNLKTILSAYFLAFSALKARENSRNTSHISESLITLSLCSMLHPLRLLCKLADLLIQVLLHPNSVSPDLRTYMKKTNQVCHYQVWFQNKRRHPVESQNPNPGSLCPNLLFSLFSSVSLMKPERIIDMHSNQSLSVSDSVLVLHLMEPESTVQITESMGVFIIFLLCSVHSLFSILFKNI